MRTELFSVRQSDEESLLFNKKIKKIVSKLEKECSLRILYKTEIDCNPKKIKKDILECLVADNPPELYIYINALDTADSSSFRRLFTPVIETLEKSLDNPVPDESTGEMLYPNVKVHPIKNLSGNYPGYCFTIRNRKFIVLPRISLVGGSLSGYLCEAVNLSKEIFNTAFTECPDGYVFLPREKKSKFSLSKLFSAPKKAAIDTEETPAEKTLAEDVHTEVTQAKETHTEETPVIDSKPEVKSEKKANFKSTSNSVAGSAILADLIEEEEAMKILAPTNAAEIDSFCIPAISSSDSDRRDTDRRDTDSSDADKRNTKSSDTKSSYTDRRDTQDSEKAQKAVHKESPKDNKDSEFDNFDADTSSLEIDLSDISGVAPATSSALEKVQENTSCESKEPAEDVKPTKNKSGKKKKNKKSVPKPESKEETSDKTFEESAHDKENATEITDKKADDTPSESDENKKDKSKKEKFVAFIKSFIPSKNDDKKTIISKSVVLAAIVAFLVGGAMLLNFYVIQPYINSRNMNDVQDVFYTSVIKDENGNVIVDGTTKNWEGIKKINKEIVGWLKVDNTVIDYPILYHKGDNEDSQYYLYRNYKKQKSAYGSIFVDYRCKKNVNSKNLILHGHNMEDGSMFASLIKYGKGDVKYYKSAPTTSFATPDRDEQWIIFAVLKVNVSNSNKTAFNYMIGDFESDAQFMNYVYSIKQLSYLNVDVPINEDDSLLTMSTCSYESQNGRTVVIARKVRPDEDVSSYIKKAKKNTPVSEITTTFSKDLEAGKIKWYDGKGNLKGEEKTEYLEPTKIYTVTYVDAKGKPLYIQRVMEGADAKPYDGELPRKAAEDGYYYKFSKWDTDTTNVQEDLTVRPVFTKHKMPTPTTTARATAKTEPETKPTQAPTPTIPNDKPEPTTAATPQTTAP